MRLAFAAGLAIAASIVCTNWSFAQSCHRLYLSGIIAGDHLSMEGSGFNTAGNFSNYGHERETNESLGFALGLEKDLGNYQLRFESEARALWDSQFTLPSFPGPPGPSSFFYRGALTDRWMTSSNIWIDKPIGDYFEVYAGGGIGVSGFKFTQSDGVVSSERRDEDIAYQFGIGLTCKLLSNVEMDFGYRRVSLGNANTTLLGSGGTTNAGNLSADLDSDQLALTFRVFQR